MSADVAAAAAVSHQLVLTDGRQLTKEITEEEELALRSTQILFADSLGEFGVFLVAFALGACLACTLPYFLDFFLATCHAPRNRRFQLFQLATGALLFLALYLAFALIHVPFATVLIASSIFSLPITYALQPLLVPYFAGFWLQATTVFEEHHRVRIGDRDIVIIALSTFFVEGREYFDETNQHGAEKDIERGQRPGSAPDAGVDEANNRYADKTVFIPNDVVLRSIVTAWWRTPRSHFVPSRTTLPRSLAVNRRLALTTPHKKI